MKRFLIVHTFGIGDWINFSPIIKLIKENIPQSEIDVVIGTPLTEKIVEFYKNDLSVRFSCDVRKNPFSMTVLALKTLVTKYDVLMFTAGINSRKIDLLSSIINARYKVALKTEIHDFKHINLWDNYETTVHRVTNNLKLAKLLEYSIPENIKTYLPINTKSNFCEKSVLIHPGSDAFFDVKRWPVEKFVKTARNLLEKNYYTSVLLGPAEDDLKSHFEKLYKYKKFQIFDGLYFSKAIEIIAEHEIILNSDSGIGHIAAALGKHVVTIFGPTDPNIFGPFTTKRRIVMVGQRLDCMPCYNSRKKCFTRPCLTMIEPRNVSDIITEFFKNKY